MAPTDYFFNGVLSHNNDVIAYSLADRFGATDR